jgi:hypothetical protein
VTAVTVLIGLVEFRRRLSQLQSLVVPSIQRSGGVKSAGTGSAAALNASYRKQVDDIKAAGAAGAWRWVAGNAGAKTTVRQTVSKAERETAK